MEIMIHETPPNELVRIITKEYTDISTINTVMIACDIERCQGDVGAFDPEEGTVFIDLAGCVNNDRWLKMGALFIANTWFNMLYAVYHEGAHAKQLLEDPSLRELEHATEIMESAAHKEALDKMFKWTDGGFRPPLSQMGWAGKEIQQKLNGIYGSFPEYASMEIDGFKAGGVADVDEIAIRQDLPKADYLSICQAIDEGRIGIKEGKERLLTSAEFFSMNDHWTEGRLSSAQTESEEEKAEEKFNEAVSEMTVDELVMEAVNDVPSTDPDDDIPF